MVQSHILGHVVRRGVEAMTTPQNEFYIQQLKKASMVYEEAGPEMRVNPAEFLPMIFTAIAFMIILASVRYTLGEVVATLAMIEQPQTTVVERSARIVDESDPDAPLEKERLIDEEIIVIQQDIITSKIRKTLMHLHRIGGFRARWRGIGASMAYHLAHSLTVNLISAFFGPSPPFRAIAYIISSVSLSMFHMTWTHVMISQPSDKPWYKRMPQDKKIFNALMLPSFVYAVAEVLTFALPVGVALFCAPAAPLNKAEDVEVGPILVRVAMGGLTMLAMSVLILLPASVTLTRIEASFLPDDQETIVPFDRTFNGTNSAITLDGSNHKSLFIESWRSFDMASRIRLIKFYVKMFFVQVMVVLVGAHIVIGQFYIFGIERLTIFLQATSAQLQLTAMGVAQN